MDEVRPYANKRCKVIVQGHLSDPYYGNLVIWDDAAGNVRIDPTTDLPAGTRTAELLNVRDITLIEPI